MDFRAFTKGLNNPLISVADEGLSAAEFTGWVDSGCYILNAAFSGSLYGGIPNNKITGFAGESATGKTFFTLGLLRQWCMDNPDGHVFYFDTEAAVTKDMLLDRGIDPAKVSTAQPSTIQQFRHMALTVLEQYEVHPVKTRKPMCFVLDSLGMLSTTKEMEDSAAGKETKDMTKAQIIKATFRVLTLKLGTLKVPLFMTNHTYDVVGAYVPTKELSGGSGFKYAASTIATLSKKKLRDENKDVVGNIIKVNMYKSRFSKENQTIEVLLHYNKGLDRYYGLHELALNHGIFKKLAKGMDINGKRVYEKELFANPEKFYTPDVMAKLELAAKKEFAYGQDEESEYVAEMEEMEAE